MPTTNVVNSSLLKIWVGATPVALAHQTDASLSVNHQVRDISSKDSAGWEESLEGMRNWEMSGQAYWAFDAAAGANANAMQDLALNRTTVAVQFGTGVTGDPKYSGTAYLTNWEGSGPGQEDNGSYSYTLKGTGALARGVYP